MKAKKSEFLSHYDERQKQFLLQSYMVAFWFVIAVLWLATLIPKLWGDTVSLDFMVSLAFWGGLAVNVSYATLKGAHPFVDDRYGSGGVVFGVLFGILGLLIIVFVFWEIIAEPVSLKVFFARGGSASIAVLGLSLLSIGASITYRHYFNRKENE